MLYVVGASLPKTDFLTKIDTVIVLTTLSLAFTGLASLILAKVHKSAGQEAAERWNLILEVGLIVSYALANAVIFGPPCVVQWRAVTRLAGYKRPSSSRTDSSDSGYKRVSTAPGSHTDSSEMDLPPWKSLGVDSDLPPTVQEGCDYITLEDLLTPQKTAGTN